MGRIEPQTAEAPVPAGQENRLAPRGGVPARAAARTPARRAPAQAAWRILCFFLLLGVVAVLLNLAINHGLRSLRTSKFGSLNRIISGKVNAEIIVSGSSRALSHYDPREIERVTGRSVYNIGMNASQIDLELAMLRLYLKQNARPRMVIQNLDLFSFETTKKGGLYDPGYYMPYLYDSEIYGFVRSIEPDAWKWKYLPLYGYAVEDMRFTWAFGLLGCLGVNTPEDYFEGFNPRRATWNRDFDRFKANLSGSVRYAVEPQGVQDLVAIIETCRERAIQVVLVYSPEYYQMQALETNRGEIIERFRQIAARFNVAFWDYSDSEFSKRRELFNNSQHLNQEGAVLFSADLARRLASEGVWERGTQLSSFKAGRRDSGAIPPQRDQTEHAP